MRLFAVGDIHGDTRLAYKLAKKAKDEDADVIVLTGDITSHTHEFENLIGPFKKLNKRIFIISGNHDDVPTTEFLSQKYGLYHLHKKSYIVDDVALFGSGGTNVGIAQLTEDELFELFKDFKYIVPQGGPMTGIGNNFQVASLSNCFVVGNGADSYGGIIMVDQEQVQLMKRRGGVGHDLQGLHLGEGERHGGLAELALEVHLAFPGEATRFHLGVPAVRHLHGVVLVRDGDDLFIGRSASAAHPHQEGGSGQERGQGPGAAMPTAAGSLAQFDRMRCHRGPW